MKFYNPRISMISIDTSITRCTCQLSMAKTLDPNFRGQPQKGQQVYDWKNPVFFSLTPEECWDILFNWDNIMNGTYVNEKEKNEKYKRNYSVKHFRFNKLSMLLINPSKTQDGTPTGSVTLTILPPQGEGAPCNYTFREYELVQFKNFLKHCANNLYYHSAIYEGIQKAKRQEEFNKKNQQNGNNQGYNNNQQGGGGNNYQQPNYNPEGNYQTFQNNPPTNQNSNPNQNYRDQHDQQGGNPVQTVSNVDDIALDNW